MSTLLILVLGVFTNAQTGATAQAAAQVSSLTECAQVSNDNREQPMVIVDGPNAGLWYLTAAECRVVEE